MAFSKLEGDIAVLQQNGVYHQCDLYTFQGGLFAKLGSGFVRLKGSGGTSKPNVMLNHIETEKELWSDQFGRLCSEGGTKRKRIELSVDDDGKVLLLDLKGEKT